METPATKNCRVEGCKRPYRSKGYCVTHFKKWRRGEMPQKTRYKTCSEENCRKPMVKWGKCEEHYKVTPLPVEAKKEEVKEVKKEEVKETKVEAKKE